MIVHMQDLTRTFRWASALHACIFWSHCVVAGDVIRPGQYTGKDGQIILKAISSSKLEGSANFGILLKSDEQSQEMPKKRSVVGCLFAKAKSYKLPAKFSRFKSPGKVQECWVYFPSDDQYFPSEDKNGDALCSSMPSRSISGDEEMIEKIVCPLLAKPEFIRVSATRLCVSLQPQMEDMCFDYRK